MPYIDPEDRNRAVITPCTPGQLNYAITALALEYLAQNGAGNWEANIRYQLINDIIGALEGAKMEFYRRVASPYEDRKRRENGDVY